MSEKLLFAANMLASKLWKDKVSPEEIKEIVCVKWDEIGDMVTAIHVFRLLKQYAPNARLTVLCKPFVGSLLAYEKGVDRVVHQLHELHGKVDVWIELRGTWKSFFTSLARTTKVRLDRGTIRFKQRGNQAHERITNFRIIEPLVGHLNWSFDSLQVNENQQFESKRIIEERNLSSFVVVHPGARSELRRWNPLKFAELIVKIHEKYQWQTLVVGTQEEQELINQIVHLSGGAAKSWVSQSSLLTFAAVISEAQLFIGNESGPLQIADAMNVRSIALFGPGVRDVFYPQTEGSKVIHHLLSCNPCDQKVCIRPSNTCMDMIEVEEVFRLV